MKALQTLPEGYHEIFAVDLQNDKKTKIWISVSATVVMLAMIFLMHLYIPMLTLIDLRQGLMGVVMKCVSMVVLSLAYIVLHELVHGVAMKLCGTKKIKYGITMHYAYAGSDEYYDKKSYIFIALAPIVLWGIVLAVVNMLVPRDWFWVIYLIQATNISGAAGDIYVTAKFSRMPADILVRDSGLAMSVYAKEKEML